MIIYVTVISGISFTCLHDLLQGWASFHSNPNSPCLMFLITSEGSMVNVDGIKFYLPHGGRQMFSLVDLRLTGWTSFASSLSTPSTLEQRSVETEGALPTIKSVRAYKIIISFSL